MLTSCTGVLHLNDPGHGATYTLYPTYPYHTVTYIKPVPYINKYSYYNQYYKPYHTHCHYKTNKTSNTYFKHRK